MERIDAALLTGVGVLVVHQIAYSASAVLGLEESIAHGHLAVAWLLGSLAALCGVARAVTRSLRGRDHTASSFTALTGWITGGYVMLELGERWLDGSGALAFFGQPVFWLGIAAAPLVALALRWSVRSATRLTEWFITVEPAIDWPEPVLQPLVVQVAERRCTTLSFTVSRRGPPARLHI
ncbi:MAG: hypothetical protein ACR2P0_14050 [Acidimicrobiales bacterium]